MNGCYSNGAINLKSQPVTIVWLQESRLIFARTTRSVSVTCEDIYYLGIWIKVFCENKLTAPSRMRNFIYYDINISDLKDVRNCEIVSPWCTGYIACSQSR